MLVRFARFSVHFTKSSWRVCAWDDETRHDEPTGVP